jgi:hypothetical protein
MTGPECSGMDYASRWYLTLVLPLVIITIHAFIFLLKWMRAGPDAVAVRSTQTKRRRAFLKMIGSLVFWLKMLYILMILLRI